MFALDDVQNKTSDILLLMAYAPAGDITIITGNAYD